MSTPQSGARAPESCPAESRVTAEAHVAEPRVTQPPPVEPRGYLFLSNSMKRGRFLVRLRRAHAWIGLWGG